MSSAFLNRDNRLSKVPNLLFINGVSWTKPEFPRHQVDKAGDALIDPLLPFDKLDEALKILNNWRSCHSYPLQSIKMTLRGRAKKEDKSSLVAQRIKRIPAIHLKLSHNPNMKLSKMHDIGGCRAVMRSVSLVEKLVKVYEDATAKNPRRGGEFTKKYDYITCPKPNGYRGIHLVYKYHSESKKFKTYNGLRIELQIRSVLQHAWATAVETVSIFTGQALKSNIGDADWKRFFALSSSAFANIEKRTITPGTPDDPIILKNELKQCSALLDMLSGFSAATEMVDKKKGHIFLLELDSENKTIQTTAFQENQLEEAQDKYLEVEKAIKDNASIQAVLVSVDSFSLLRKAYPNYFLDVKGFYMTIAKFVAG